MSDLKVGDRVVLVGDYPIRGVVSHVHFGGVVYTVAWDLEQETETLTAYAMARQGPYHGSDMLQWYRSELQPEDAVTKLASLANGEQ